MFTHPLLGINKPFIVFNKLDFPAPVSPTMATKEEGGMVKLISYKTLDERSGKIL